MKTFLLSVAFLLIGVVVAVGTLFVFRAPIVSWIGATTDKSTRIVNAVERTQEVALVTLSIEGIEERKTDDGQLLFLSIPNSRTTFVRYSFDAKLGFDAKGVDIDERPDGSFVVRIPSFSVIGLDNQHVETAVEDNDLLNWTTPEINKDDIYNAIFGDDLEAEYIAKNTDLLQDQAWAFYASIIHSIDPDIALEFEFAQ